MKQPARLLKDTVLKTQSFDRCNQKSLRTFGNVADVVSLVIVALVVIATGNGIYRIILSGRRRTILPSTRRNMPDHISEGAVARRRRSSGSRRDRSLVGTTAETLGSGSEAIGAGVQEAQISSEEVSAIEKRLVREGAKRGSVQITLAWDNWNDLDLHVITPSGEHIYHDHRKSDCGGELDVDMNFKPTSKTPVESIVWTDTPPPGVYRIGIRHYKIHKKGILSWAPLISNIHKKNATNFTVSVTIGQSKRFYEGVVEKSNDLQFVAKFAIAEPGEGGVQPVEEASVLESESSEDFTEAREIEAMRRRVGTVSDGVSVEMDWESESDLGLSVVNSEGDEVSFFSPDGIEGGSFDLQDFTVEGRKQKIIWAADPPSGDYSVLVQHYESEGQDASSDFSIVINNRGDVQELSGSVNSDGSKVFVGSFEV